MNLLKSFIAGTAYGVHSSEDELAAEKQMAFDIMDQDVRFYKKVGIGKIMLVKAIAKVS